MKKEWLDSKWINATPLIIFLVFYAFFGLCQEFLTTDYDTKLFQLNTENDIQTVTRKYSGRFVWVFFTGINAFLGVVGLVIYFLLIHKSKDSFRYIIICLFVCPFFGLILLLANSDTPVIEPVISLIFGEHPNDLKQYATVIFATKVINFIADMVAVATALTIYAILSRDKDGSLPSAEMSKNDLDINLKKLLDKVEDLRIVLYIATLLLVVGVLRMSAVLNWSLKSLLENPETLKQISEFFATFTFIIGSLYTILLASMYIPAYYILQKRASAFVDKSDYTKDKLAEDFKLEFFGFSIKDSLPRILAIIAPFLTGAITEPFLKLFK